MNKMKLRILNSLFCLCIMAAVLFPVAANARGLVDVTKGTSLTLTYPYRDAEFAVYHVAMINEFGDIVPTDDFSRYQVSLEQAGWRSLAETLAAYVARDKLTPCAVLPASDTGMTEFRDLSVGVYLVVGSPLADDTTITIMQPFIVSLPNYDTETDSWVYNVVAEPKYRKQPVNVPLNRRVLKVWDDDGKDSFRPNEIEIELLRDGVVWDIVTLNEKNNWRYSWENLDGRYVWVVTERNVPEGYTVVIVNEGTAFIVTNTRSTPLTPTEPPSSTPPVESETPSVTPLTPVESVTPGHPNETPTPFDSGTPNIPSETPTPAIPPTTPVPKLPQTGQLWWPVGILSGCGLVVFFMGWIKQRQDDEKKEQ